jgi:hypothetical protein
MTSHTCATVEARLQHVLTLVGRLRAVGGHVGCCGHMVFETNEHRAEVILGAASGVVGGVAVLDWRRAPVASVFFACAEGEELDVVAQGRASRTRLLERNLLVLDEVGHLCELRTPVGRVAVCDGQWSLLPPREAVSPVRSLSGSGRQVPPIEDLDGLQQAVARLPAGRASLIWPCSATRGFA